MAKFFTGAGDDGYTGLLGDQRVPKHSARPEAYGSVDEASAALGVARSMTGSEDIAQVVAEVQRDLYKLMAELAAIPEQAERFRQVDHTRVAWLEAQVERFGELVDLPREFVIGGDSRAGGFFDLARTLVRRAERSVAALMHAGQLENDELVRYLNRLSSLCFVLELYENQLAGVDRPSLAKGSSA